MASPVNATSGTSNKTGGTTATITVTCPAKSVIVLCIQSDVTTSASAFTNSMLADTSGILWGPQHFGSAGISNAPGSTAPNYALCDVWVGIALTALTAATVTVTASATVDAWALTYTSWTGCAGTLVDPNLSAPFTATHTNSGGGAAVQVS